MNDHDKDNLQFILSLSDKQFDDWASEMTDDDIQYAMEILQAARLELSIQEHNVIEDELDGTNLAEANAVLKKFML